MSIYLQQIGFDTAEIGRTFKSLVQGPYLYLAPHLKLRYGDYFCIGVAAYPEGHTDCVRRLDRVPKVALDPGLEQ